jgi:hypothetical protein
VRALHELIFVQSNMLELLPLEFSELDIAKLIYCLSSELTVGMLALFPSWWMYFFLVFTIKLLMKILAFTCTSDGKPLMFI